MVLSLFSQLSLKTVRKSKTRQEISNCRLLNQTYSSMSSFLIFYLNSSLIVAYQIPAVDLDRKASVSLMQNKSAINLATKAQHRACSDKSFHKFPHDHNNLLYQWIHGFFGITSFHRVILRYAHHILLQMTLYLNLRTRILIAGKSGPGLF